MSSIARVCGSLVDKAGMVPWKVARFSPMETSAEMVLGVWVWLASAKVREGPEAKERPVSSIAS